MKIGVCLRNVWYGSFAPKLSSSRQLFCNYNSVMYSIKPGILFFLCSFRVIAFHDRFFHYILVHLNLSLLIFRSSHFILGFSSLFQIFPFYFIPFGFFLSLDFSEFILAFRCSLQAFRFLFFVFYLFNVPPSIIPVFN